MGFRNFGSENRYITGTLDQKSLSMSIRANYSLTPNLTIEYWGQPFNSIGNYSEFKYITDSQAKEFTDRFQLFSSEDLDYDDEQDLFLVSESGFDYSFNNPDFNFLQWRSNLVMRWEYKPGSEFFLVWTQSTTNFSDPSQGIFNSLGNDLFSDTFDNIFLMKFTYRFY